MALRDLEIRIDSSSAQDASRNLQDLSRQSDRLGDSSNRVRADVGGLGNALSSMKAMAIGGRSRQTGSKLRFDISIAADQADLASLLSHYQSHIATPFDFIYQGETPEITRTVVYVEPPVFNAADGSFVEIKLVLEEV